MTENVKKVASKSRGFFGEFREFILRGNVMDLAVGVIIGGAFQKIINSLVDDIIMPVISQLFGGLDFTNYFIALDGNHYKTIAAAEEAGVATLNYGSFITVVINFVLMALVIFVMIKCMNRLMDRVKSEPEPADPTEKECPYCKSKIAIGATRCPQCTSEL